MKVFKLLLLFIFLSITGYCQTTAWSTSPAVTPQTRVYNGAKQIRWLWGSYLYSLADSIAANHGNTYTASHGARLVGLDIQTDSTYFPRGFTIVLTSLTHDTTYSNSSLASRTFTLFQNGINRYLLPTEYRVRTGGGFDLFNPLLAGDEIILATTSYIAPSTNGVQVATFAAMVAYGQPIAGYTVFKVLADENKNYTNSTYIWWSNGKRVWVASSDDN